MSLLLSEKSFLPDRLEQQHTHSSLADAHPYITCRCFLWIIELLSVVSLSFFFKGRCESNHSVKNRNAFFRFWRCVMSLKNLLGSIKVRKGERVYSLSSVDDIVKMLFNRKHNEPPLNVIEFPDEQLRESGNKQMLMLPSEFGTTGYDTDILQLPISC